MAGGQSFSTGHVHFADVVHSGSVVRFSQIVGCH